MFCFTLVRHYPLTDAIDNDYLSGVLEGEMVHSTSTKSLIPLVMMIKNSTVDYCVYDQGVWCRTSLFCGATLLFILLLVSCLVLLTTLIFCSMCCHSPLGSKLCVPHLR